MLGVLGGLFCCVLLCSIFSYSSLLCFIILDCELMFECLGFPYGNPTWSELKSFVCFCEVPLGTALPLWDHGVNFLICGFP